MPNAVSSDDNAQAEDAGTDSQPASPMDATKQLMSQGGATPADDSSNAGGSSSAADAARQFGSAAAITSIDGSSGLVTARENRTGRIFRFRLSNANALRSLRVGQPLSADFAGHQIALPFNGQVLKGRMVGGQTDQQQ